jgi:hypothetical protein
LRGNDVKTFKIGKHIIPLWLIAVILSSAVGSGALGYYIWTRLTIPLEIKEPIEILDYPSKLSLYPGENESFQVSLVNHASVNYSVVLVFSLDNITYQENYVTFTDEIYRVILGQQNLTAWLMVESDAPPINTSLNIDFKRTIEGRVLFFDDFNDNVADGWTKNLGTWDAISGMYRVSVTGIVEDGISTVDTLNLTNCMIEVKVRFADDVGFRAGIVFRYTDNEHYYAFDLSNEYDVGHLTKYSSDDPHYGHPFADTGGYFSYSIQTNVDYLLKIEIRGDTFKCFINNIEVFSGTDGTYSSGKVGLRAGRAIAYFDNFKITEIP